MKFTEGMLEQAIRYAQGVVNALEELHRLRHRDGLEKQVADFALQSSKRDGKCLLCAALIKDGQHGEAPLCPLGKLINDD